MIGRLLMLAMIPVWVWLVLGVVIGLFGTVIVLVLIIGGATSSIASDLHYQCDSAVGPDPSETVTPSRAPAAGPSTTRSAPAARTSIAPTTNPFAELTIAPDDTSASDWQRACTTALKDAPYQSPLCSRAVRDSVPTVRVSSHSHSWRDRRRVKPKTALPVRTPRNLLDRSSTGPRPRSRRGDVDSPQVRRRSRPQRTLPGNRAVLLGGRADSPTAPAPRLSCCRIPLRRREHAASGWISPRCRRAIWFSGTTGTMPRPTSESPSAPPSSSLPIRRPVASWSWPSPARKTCG